MPALIPVDIDQAAFAGKPAPRVSRPTRSCVRTTEFVYAKGHRLRFQMGLRPQTLYGIANSPVGLAAYFLDHDARATR